MIKATGKDRLCSHSYSDVKKGLLSRESYNSIIVSMLLEWYLLISKLFLYLKK